MPKVLEAYRSGGGVPWEQYGPDGIEGQGDFNRPWLLGQLGTEYLPSIPDVHARLKADPPAHVADIACGVGWASIAIARAYPKAIVHGFDLDKASLAHARRNAAVHGLADRVKFRAGDVSSLSTRRRYDLAIVVEAIHDLTRPVETLAAIRRLLSPSGSLIVADERVADSFTVPGDDLERLMYGASLLVCLPAGMAEQPSAATGTVMRTVMRAGTLRRYAAQAGFRGVQVLPLEHPTLRFYRLTP